LASDRESGDSRESGPSAAWAAEELVCPADHAALRREEATTLACGRGHRYRIVDGVPVMLIDEKDPTMWVGPASLEAAWGGGYDVRLPGYYLETLGLEDFERDAIADLARRGSPVDPVVSFIVGATSGHMYSRLIGKLTAYPIPVIRLPPSRGARFLDLGCNWGRWTIAAARKGYQAVGIDPSLGAVLAAQRVARELGVSARFVVADARRLPFPPSSFDVAFSYSVFQHFSRANVVQTLRDVRRVLAPGGQVMIQMAHRTGIRSLYHNARRGFRERCAFDVRYWGFDELKRTFSAEIGPCHIEVDGFFGVGLQPSDAPMLDPVRRGILRTSEALRRASEAAPILRRIADSLYVHASVG
jgi:SAM-dependent methyltransferase